MIKFNKCYGDDCDNEILPFSCMEGDDVGFCYVHAGSDDIESLGHCPKCNSEDVTKSLGREVIKTYTDYFKLTENGFEEDDEIDDDDVNSNGETITEEIECNDCDFSKYWDFR